MRGKGKEKKLGTTEKWVKAEGRKEGTTEREKALNFRERGKKERMEVGRNRNGKRRNEPQERVRHGQEGRKGGEQKVSKEEWKNKGG